MSPSSTTRPLAASAAGQHTPAALSAPASRSLAALVAPARRAHLLAAAACALLVCAWVSPAARAEECPNAAFRIGPSSHLPDCRAYELVSPPFKDAGALKLEDLSPEGTSLMMEINGATEGLEGFPGIGDFKPGAYYSTVRTATGWKTVSDDPPSTEYVPVGTEGRLTTGEERSSLDGQTTAWNERWAKRPPNGAEFFLRLPNREIAEVGPGVPPTVPQELPFRLGAASGVEIHATSADLSHLVFGLHGDHWPFDSTLQGESLYEYIGTGNTEPLLVAVNDAGEQIGQCGNGLGANNGSEESGSVDNAMSLDGSVVYFTVAGKRPACAGSAPPVNELFARIDNGTPSAHTVAISEPSKEDCATCDTESAVLAEARFTAAAEDGSKAFFVTAQPLLPGAGGNVLYEYDFDASVGERVTRIANQPENLLVSEDGSHVYFTDKLVLSNAPNGEGEAALAGGENLYVFERDAAYPSGRLAFVARLSVEDARIFAHGGYEQVASPVATPDGNFLVFASERDLTPDTTTSGGVWQLFEYDGQSGSLVRVSIGDQGFNRDGNVPAVLNPAFPGETLDGLNDASLPTLGYEDPSVYWSHLAVSANGEYVFFQSTVGLTPQALNEKIIGYQTERSFYGTFTVPIYANNVYEYHDGRVSLISDGQDLTIHSGATSEVQLLGTDESGRDVFFTTTDRLVGQDTDDNLDIYDARVDGGFPPPAAPPSCSGEGCQGALSGAPTLLSPGSEFQAGGNPPLASPAPATKQAKQKPKVAKKVAKKKAVKRCGRRGCSTVKGRKAKRPAAKRRAK